MKCSLGISNFLEEISNLSHSVVFLYFFALVAEEGFLISSCYSLELCIQMLIFPFLLCFSLFFFSQLFVRPPQTAILLLCISFPWERSVFIPIPKKGNAKECSNYRTIPLIVHASKVILKILQGKFQQYVNCKLPDIQAGFRKGRGTRDQIANIRWIIKKAREFQKNIYFCFLIMSNPLNVWITRNFGKF